MVNDSTETNQLIEDAERGDEAAFNQLIQRHRNYLRRIVDLRLEPAMRTRIDPSDVVQEAQLAASQRFEDFANRRSTSFRLWLRGQAINLLTDQRRRHYAQKRSVKREVYLSDASSMVIARRLASGTPSKAAQRREVAAQIRSAMGEMKEADREVLLLRYIEGLTNSEVAELLQIDRDTASRRHGRAIRRLCRMLAARGIVEGQ